MYTRPRSYRSNNKQGIFQPTVTSIETLQSLQNESGSGRHPAECRFICRKNGQRIDNGRLYRSDQVKYYLSVRSNAGRVKTLGVTSRMNIYESE